MFIPLKVYHGREIRSNDGSMEGAFQFMQSSLRGSGPQRGRSNPNCIVIARRRTKERSKQSQTWIASATPPADESATPGILPRNDDAVWIASSLPGTHPRNDGCFCGGEWMIPSPAFKKHLSLRSHAFLFLKEILPPGLKAKRQEKQVMG